MSLASKVNTNCKNKLKINAETLTDAVVQNLNTVKESEVYLRAPGDELCQEGYVDSV